ncbi:hypothetical protein C449_00010 [Halococcus saccharolyticus DSM 5350]|uniref:Uncharacterized protein n=1 Tax=Halococcus saccharolyticus DSM 5350 TaxID=1227455 RepID=M0MTF9_9EURY|nr:hypothetical protein C449_00010 [Halococcus saccharolyticus DSM 5350]
MVSWTLDRFVLDGRLIVGVASRRRCRHTVLPNQPRNVGRMLVSLLTVLLDSTVWLMPVARLEATESTR